MSVKQDQMDESERVTARKKAIKEALAATDRERSEPNKEQSTEQSTAQPEQPQERMYYGRPLHPWEAIVNGRPQQVRPMTSREVEAMDEKTLMENIKRQDEAHQRKVQAAIRERDAEQKDMDKRRAHEKKTGRRPYGEKRFIPLEQAIREGYVGQSSGSGSNNGRPEWWSEGNPDGIMGGGR